MDLDELRSAASGRSDDDDEPDTADDLPVFDQRRARKRFLGMTAVERMFLAIFLFLNVLIIGVALLLATGRLVL